MMGFGDLADRLLSGLDAAREGAESLLEPSLRLGVTGLSGAGKTVFITSLVASLLAPGRMRLLSAEADGRLIGSALRTQPDPGVPRFAFESHRLALTGEPRVWPESTRAVSQLRLGLRYRPSGWLSGLAGPAVLNLDIVDYPGEWLADLALMEQDYADWASAALSGARTPARAAHAAAFLRALGAADAAATHSEPAAEALAAAFASYLAACRQDGLAAMAPGRFLLPGDLAGSPALTFAPLARPATVARDSLYAEMRRRYDAYRRVVVTPFFRDHFARLDRQVVLVDVLGALSAGPEAVANRVEGMSGMLSAFRHGAGGWLDRLAGRRKIDRLLFAATKADRIHHEQHARLGLLADAMLAEAAARARFSGAEVRAMAIAAVRASVEQTIDRDGRRIGVVRGRRIDTGREVAVFPGDLPEDPRPLLAAALGGGGGAIRDWPSGGFASVRFAPPAWGGGQNDGPPHIRLDRALDFLIGDRLE